MQALKTPRGSRAAFALVAFAATAVASAAQVTYSFDSGKTGLNIVNSGFTLPRFDSTLGTLTSVDFSLGGKLWADVSLAALSTTANQRISATVGMDMSLTSDDLAAWKVADAYTSAKMGKYGTQSYTKSPDGLAHFDGVHGEKFAFDPAAISALNASYSVLGSTDASVLSAVTGASALKFKLNATDHSVVTEGGANALASRTTYAEGFGSITYHYRTQAVPEPTSVAALGLGALGLLRRRNRKGGAR